MGEAWKGSVKQTPGDKHSFLNQGKKPEQIFLFSVKQKSKFPWLFLARREKKNNILFGDSFFSVKAESSHKILAASTFSPFHFSLLD